MKFNPLDALIEESRKSRDKVGRTLAEDRRTQQQTARQLDTLTHYKQEYRRRLHDALMDGMDVGLLNNYQSFIHSLDDAIGCAGVRLQQHSNKVSASQQQWRQQQKQLSSYDTLASRRTAREHLKQTRQEQRRNDEATNNAQARQRSGGR